MSYWLQGMSSQVARQLELQEHQARLLEAALEDREGTLAQYQQSEDVLARHCRNAYTEVNQLVTERSQLQTWLQVRLWLDGQHAESTFQ
jgi:hypothetical protein